MNRVEININPLVLRWAREEAGYEISEIADRLDVGSDRYKIWEKEGKSIPLGKLRKLADTYKRQLAVFLLPEVPKKISKPQDYRRLSQADRRLSRKPLEVIREVKYFRETAYELHGENYWASRYEWLSDLRKDHPDIDSLTADLRELLDISLEDQISWKSDSAAYKNWRQAVEDKLGILVFQFSMPMEEVQGFCFTDGYPYAIVTNSNHSYTGRIFTIFHELAHILRNNSGICLYEQATERQAEEWECNLFAGKFLAPANAIVKSELEDEIRAFSARLHISREVYLRRLKEERLISDTKFFKMLSQVKATYPADKKKKGFVKPEVKSRAERGETFFNMVLDAMSENRISYSRASSALNLNLNALLNEV
ncbi:MAG: ImmA/IrrE family metallo-endopeptidase [Ignavibacteriaceae bacterium]|nr:ImmA/IrrE family metallo-endopeptidase [Ignavibacteriaceae bacterium]